jgi:hypothetical protein
MTPFLHAYLVAGCLLAACTPSAAHQQTARGSAPAATPAPAPSAPPAQAQQMPKGSNVNPDAGLVAEFRKKVDAYVKLRKGAEDAAPDLKRTDKPAEIVVAEKTMAQRVREARATAQRGDIFTPATQAMFRRLLRPPLTKGEDAAENKAIIKDGAPEPKEVPFKINADYPKEAPLSTVPPDVLLTLPQLPEDVQYRFVGKHLVLYDAKANLIIDFMLNAIP